ncbi:MAG: box helicase [Hydrocarboniphaga sp.]|uniref:DEAD/DEAH box helicase n=1 Tax=Hydrocarboniphaga sp. TaxID=2033016 RepID=UPI0026308B1B|nr:DEAD/DEAH box helicase [Hydrocarboniphaga sp.]MDB5968885.1 box helicase [Hydrocarboniphaga sp.]
MQFRLDLAGRSTAESREGPFHPAVSGWLKARFGQATEVQQRAWTVTSQHRHALIAAPTGSGKTLAAFLAAINDLVEEGLEAPLADRVYVLYVSPLKALSNDIQKNLQEPLAGIREQLAAMGLPEVGIRDAVRTGDTPVFERERMKKNPPHILVTTPESLFILMTSNAGRSMLGGVKTVIVDELHAVAGGKRGAHLMLTLERLDALCAAPPVRIGLSATVKPLDAMARYLIGVRDEPVHVVDTGHIRERDIALEVPRSSLTPVMAGEVWDETYDRLAELIEQHKTTLIFVNQRRIAERTARHLAERIGEEHVTSHHGSLSREHRLNAEQRLKSGTLKVLVATSSLELGIDIGDIDLVCQLGSPRAINAFLQRVGRAGHAIGAIPKGRLFPLTTDDLLECTALLHAVQRGELDRIRLPRRPLDVLAQQIVAEIGCGEWGIDDLYARFRRADPYRELTLPEFEQVVQMLSDGYTTRRGRRGAYLHLDAVNRRLRARPGAKLTAVMNAGTIPDQFDYEVVLQPEGHRVGTLNEDFAFESMVGDIFQLGNTSYRMLKIETSRVLVEDAKGQPPTIPFWFGEVPGRTDELSAAVSDLSEHAQQKLAEGLDACTRWLVDELGLPESAAQQLSQYWGAALAMIGVLPSAKTVVFERFFDEVGDTHLVIHSPFGSRVNRAWGLALRKRFCRAFNFELQASALEDSIVLSLGPTHSFPLDTVQHYLKSASARQVLIQALLDAPMFGTRWRWNASVALAIRRMNAGKRVPPQFQRSDSEDLLTLVFPDQVACAENLVGEREIPNHPLVQQTLSDCLHETMDVEGFERVLARMESGEIKVVCCDLAAPSPLSQAVLNARPYAFLDDGAAEERRTRALAMQPMLDVQTAANLGRLDLAAIERVRAEAWPEFRSADELHDALCVHAFLTENELAAAMQWLDELVVQRRVTRLQLTPVGADLVRDEVRAALEDSRTRSAPTVGKSDGDGLWVAAERLHEFRAALPRSEAQPPIRAVSVIEPVAEDALREILRSRLELLGPVTAEALAAPLQDLPGTRAALLQLEAEGAVISGSFTAPGAHEWCDRRLLARIHRYTRDRQRAEAQPVAPAQFMRFLFGWHRIAGSNAEARHQGDGGLVAALQQLEGFAAPAGSWEDDLLPSRVDAYAPAMLDRVCSSGRVVWQRPVVETPEGTRRRGGPVRTTPIVLCEREFLAHWSQRRDAEPSSDEERPLSSRADRLLDALKANGASFYDELAQDSGLLSAELGDALGELVSAGLVTCDSFAGLRALTMSSDKRDRLRRRFGRGDIAFDDAGRWSLTRPRRVIEESTSALADPRVEHIARVLLRRYGVVFRKLLEREADLPPWRELHYVYRRLEARGEIRGGRFVSGFSGEQFALIEAAGALKRYADTQQKKGVIERVCIGAGDPLNLVGILVPGDKLARLPGNRVVFEDGVPVAVQSSGETRYLRETDLAEQWEIRNLMIRKQSAISYLQPPSRPQ